MKKVTELINGNFKSLLIMDTIYHKSACIFKELSRGFKVVEYEMGQYLTNSENEAETLTTNKTIHDKGELYVVKNFNMFTLLNSKFQIISALTSLLQLKQLIIIIHMDIEYGLDLLPFLKDICQNSITLSPDRDEVKLPIYFRLKGGNHYNLEYTMNPFKLYDIQSSNQKAPEQQPKVESTFNLELNQKQEQKRSELVLPHYEARKSETVIEYDMDEYDSDPDDDLEL